MTTTPVRTCQCQDRGRAAFTARSTHVQSLGIDTPKGRRRIRSILGMDKHEVVTIDHVTPARILAHQIEIGNHQKG